MKHLLLSAGLICMSVFAFSQNGERSKDYPRFEKETQKRTRDNARGVFQQRFEMQTEDELRGDKSENDQIGYTHDKYQQYYKNVKVEGAVYTAHSKNNVIESYSGEFKGIKNFDVSPSVSSSQGLDAAMAHAGGTVYAWDNSVKAGYPEYKKPTGELVIIGGGNNDNEELTLAWKYDIYSVSPLYRAEVYVNAKTGDYVKENLLIHTANAVATGVSTLYNGVQTITTDMVSPTSYRLRETRGTNSGIETYNLNNGSNYGTATDFTSADNITWSDPVGTQAHFGAERTYDYYLNKFGRNSFNAKGGKILSYVHYSSNYANAFWDGTRMTYGDGQTGTTLNKALVSVDVCGHEITHGVTTYSANLTYSYESGALNESFSDIFGECIEKYATGTNDWIMGCDITTSTSCGIRSMANPKLKSQPEYYKGQLWYTGTADGGGVHTNSGVQNKWFYLITVGGAFTNEKGVSFNLTGLGIDQAAAISYRTLTTYLTASSNYLNARTFSIKAAEDLYGVGSTAASTVASAWDAVGVVPDVQAPTAPTSVSITTKSTTSIGLTWKAATDNVGVTAYDVYYQTGTGAYLVKSNITTTTYSLTGLTANTSYNIYVVAKDGSGNVSPALSTINVKTLASNETLVGAYYFETSLSPWTAGGANALWTNNATYAYEGVGSAQTRGSGATAVLNSPKLNLTGYTQVELKFNFTPIGMSTGQGIIVKYNNNGTTFTAIPTISTNGLSGFYTATILFNTPAYTFNTNGKFTIECAGATTANQIYIDAVTVIGRKSTTATGTSTTITSASKGVYTLGLTNAMMNTGSSSNLPDNAKLYPNPVYSQLLINANSQVKAIRLLNANGTLVKSIVGKAGYSSIDVSKLPKGIYFAEIISADAVVRKKIIKQ